MGAALGAALAANKQWKLFAYDKDKRKTKSVRKAKIFKNAADLIRNSDTVVLAVKPQDLGEFIAQHQSVFKDSKPLVISIAAGISTKFFESRLEKIRVIRCMPNMAVKVKGAISFICQGRYSRKSDIAVAKRIFSAVGEVILTEEKFLDKVTALTGSGPGFIFYLMDSFYKTAVKLGFTKHDARKMVVSTFLGTAKLADNCSQEFAALVKAVASPGGTTEAGLKVFSRKKVDLIVHKAVGSAYKRAGQISSRRS